MTVEHRIVEGEGFYEGCPACQMAAKEAEAAQGRRCVRCLASFADSWVQSETQPELCRGCASAVPATRPSGAYGAGRNAS